jgi:Holliday junction resolvase
MLESELKRRGTKLLEKWGWMVIHLVQTNCNGIPDTLILRKTTAYFIEFKQPGKVPRELQQYRIRKLQEQGFQTLVVTDLKDIEKLR